MKYNLNHHGIILPMLNKVLKNYSRLEKHIQHTAVLASDFKIEKLKYRKYNPSQHGIVFPMLNNVVKHYFRLEKHIQRGAVLASKFKGKSYTM